MNEEDRLARMVKVNPVYVPRNWILQEAINDAEKNDFEKVCVVTYFLKIDFTVPQCGVVF